MGSRLTPFPRRESGSTFNLEPVDVNEGDNWCVSSRGRDQSAYAAEPVDTNPSGHGTSSSS